MISDTSATMLTRAVNWARMPSRMGGSSFPNNNRFIHILQHFIENQLERTKGSLSMLLFTLLDFDLLILLDLP